MFIILFLIAAALVIWLFMDFLIIVIPIVVVLAIISVIVEICANASKGTGYDYNDRINQNAIYPYCSEPYPGGGYIGYDQGAGNAGALSDALSFYGFSGVYSLQDLENRRYELTMRYRTGPQDYSEGMMQRINTCYNVLRYYAE